MSNCLDCYGDFKLGLSIDEVKEFFKLEYGKKWRGKLTAFNKFIIGQTGAMSHGIMLYYRCDIANFMRPLDERFWD